MSEEQDADDLAWDKWLEHCRTELVPMIKQSAFTIQLLHGDPDPKAAVELGMTLLLDKPLIIVVWPGSMVPRRLARAADEIVEWTGPPDNPAMSARIAAAIDRVNNNKIPPALRRKKS